MIKIGIDFQYQFHLQLSPTLIKTLVEIKDKYIDIVKIRAAEDKWRPSNLKTFENLNKLCSELDNLGIAMPKSFIENVHLIPLTNNILTFSKQYIGIVEDCLSIYVPEIISIIDEIFIDVLYVQIQHLIFSFNNAKTKQEVIFFSFKIYNYLNVVL